MEYYKVLVVGASGKGKTYAARNLNPETTGFINVEDKPLPYKILPSFHKRISKYEEIVPTIVEFAKNPKIEVIVVDSFSACAELFLKEARATKKNFDIWNFYNEQIGNLLSLIKKVPKDMIITSHYEILNVEGDNEKRVKVKGKEWEGQH